MAKGFKGDVKSFTHVNDFLAQFDKHGALVEDYTGIDIGRNLHTGNYLLNALWSGDLTGGAPTNKIVTIAGDPKTGKSYLMFNIMKSFQEDGWMLWFFETENSPTKEKLKTFGIDFGKCRISQPETANEITVMIAQLTETMLVMKREKKELPKIAIFIDSLNGLLGQKQINDAIEGNMKTDMGSQAKELKLMMNIASTRLGKCGIPMYCTAHVMTRDIQGTQYKEKIISGGMGSIYFSSIIALLTKSHDRDENDKAIKVGVKVNVETIENRMVAPGKKIEMKIRFDRGMNPYLGLDNFVSIDTCGIGKGKFVEFYDLIAEFVAKKKAKVGEIGDYYFDYKDALATVSKDKQEYFYFNLRKHIEKGMVYVVGGVDLPDSDNMTDLSRLKFGFTEEYKERVNGDKYEKVKPFEFAFAKETSPEWVVESLGKTLPTKDIFGIDGFGRSIFTPETLLKMNKLATPFFSYGSVSEKAAVEEQEFMSEEEIEKSVSELNIESKK